MTRLIIFMSVALLLSSCKEKKDNNPVQEVHSRKEEVSLRPGGDTDFVRLEYSNISLIIRYSHNKPQYVQVSNTNGGDSLVSHFAKAYRGVYFLLDAVDSSEIRGAGFKYLNGDAGADITVDPRTGTMKDFTYWEQYNNNGTKYNLSRVRQGEIKAYMMTEDDKTDSVVFVRKK